MIGRIGAIALAVMSSVTAQTPLSASVPLNVTLSSYEASVIDVMGGTFVPTPHARLLEEIQNGYLAWVGATTPDQALTTPEGFSESSYNVGEQDLQSAVAAAPDGSTFIGYSQSAGIIGMLLNEDPAVVKPGDHLVAFAPPNMPHAGIFDAGSVFNKGGLMTDMFGAAATTDFPGNVTLAAGASVDVYCGEYDPICGPPPVGSHSLLAWLNAEMAGFYVHDLYPSDTAAQFDNAVPINIDDTGNVHFFMLPDQNQDVLPLFDWLAPLDHQLAVQLSAELRPEIDAAYSGSVLYDAMTAVDGTDAASATADAVAAF